MTTKRPFTALSLAAALNLLTHSASADAEIRVDLRRTGANLELQWPANSVRGDGSTFFPFFEVQRSSDLTHWKPLGERQRGSATLTEMKFGLTPTPDEPRSFYRLLAVMPPAIARMGSGGAEVFGYGDAFAADLARIGQITPEGLATLFPNTANYLPSISWDSTNATFWNLFNANPVVVNADKAEGDPGYRYTDYRLNPSELAVFKKNGFVVSENLGSPSFAESYYNLWHSDMPVFISSDALLQAWHRTYDAMLEETEETYLFNSVQTMLDGMAGQVSAAAAQAGDGVLKDCLLDADYFLAVARSLLAGTNNPPVASLLGQDSRVAETLADINAQALKQVNGFMGFCRVVDFSQFTVRGHYTHSERLGQYFKCVKWLGQIDLPVAGGPWERCPGDSRSASPRELGTAIVLWHLLTSSGQFNTWQNVEQILQTFIGSTDSMTFGQLGGLLAGAGVHSLADVADLGTLEKIQADILSGELGVQNIRSDWFAQPLGGVAQYALPRTFTVLGQKFVPDSWAFSQTVFDSISWVGNGQTNKVQRRVPGALDVAFAVLGNNQIEPELVSQMKGTFPNAGRPHAQAFRDGFPYQHNLAAVRTVMDSQESGAWESNILAESMQ